MSKVTQYRVLVNGKEEVVDSMRQLSKLVGRKVTRAMVENNEVPEIIEVIPTSIEGITLNDPLGNDDPEVSPVGPTSGNSEEAVDLTIEEEAKIQEIIDGGNEEDIETTEEYVEEHTNNEPEDTTVVNCTECGKELGAEDTIHVIDGNTILCDECKVAREEANNPDPTPEGNEEDNEDKPKDMASLLARMRELNAKKAATKGDTTTTKGKRGKKIEFTGEYPEVGFFKEKKDLQKFYKQLDDTQLEDWLELEGLTYKQSDNEPINRMRKCMAILALHFPPQTKGSSKKKSKYADFSTEELLEMALENDVEVADGKGDPRILRMYTIMALKKAGLLE